jgi:multidrug efflux pump subunit AcrB
MGAEFFKRGDQGKFEAIFELQPGTAIEETNKVALQAEKILKELPECPNNFTRVGIDRDVAKFSVMALCSGVTERKRGVDDLMADARERLAVIPGKLTMRIPDLANNGQPAPLTLLITGPDFDELQRTANRAFEIVKATPGVVDAGISVRPGAPEQRFVVDRTKAADRGVPFAWAAQALRAAVEGEVVATMPDRGDDVDVRVRLQQTDRASLDELKKISVMSRSGQMVQLDELVRVEEVPSASVIERNNRQRSISISANLHNTSLGEAVNLINPQLDQIMKPGYAYKYEGDAQNMKDTFTNMLIALALAILFIYFVLASQFESFVHPFTIMMALPLAIIGALAGLFLAGESLGMPAMIGIILLMGLVTKNGILLVDYTNQLRDQGLGLMEALLKAGPTRLRPILMTSAAIVLGELPTALSSAEGSEFNRPMAVGVIGGVITSTLLTLVVVPVAYVWIDKLSIKKRVVKPAAVSTPAE